MLAVVLLAQLVPKQTPIKLHVSYVLQANIQLLILNVKSVLLVNSLPIQEHLLVLLVHVVMKRMIIKPRVFLVKLVALLLLMVNAKIVPSLLTPLTPLLVFAVFVDQVLK